MKLPGARAVTTLKFDLEAHHCEERMSVVPGTSGYERSVDRFLEISQALNFREVCSDFLPFLPTAPARVLDVGAGAGQNSAALADMGYSVVAVEPMSEFLVAAREKYSVRPIQWIQDCLPRLADLRANDKSFDLILVEAVWHHLDPSERIQALKRLGSLLSSGGRLAISLRNGPAGQGTHVFPTNPQSTTEQAGKLRMKCLLRKENLSSALPNKEDVVWSRLVFEKA